MFGIDINTPRNQPNNHIIVEFKLSISIHIVYNINHISSRTYYASHFFCLPQVLMSFRKRFLYKGIDNINKQATLFIFSIVYIVINSLLFIIS